MQYCAHLSRKEDKFSTLRWRQIYATSVLNIETLQRIQALRLPYNAVQNFYYLQQFPIQSALFSLCVMEKKICNFISRNLMLKIVGQRLSRNREEFGRLGSVFLQRPSHYGGQREAEQTPGKIQGWPQMFGSSF